MASTSDDLLRYAAAALVAAALTGCGGDDHAAVPAAEAPARVAYLQEPTGVWDLVLHRPGLRPQTILRHSPVRRAAPTAFSFTPGGRSVVVVESAPSVQRLLEVTVADRSRRVIGAYAASTYYAIATAPDGERIAVVRASESGEDFAIEILRLDGTSLRTVGAGVDIGSGISWSPDGRWVAYAHSAGHHGGGASHVRLVDAETGEEQTYDDRLEGRDPAFAPNGTLAFASSKGIVVVPSGGDPKRVTGGGVDASPSFSPDGKRIAYQHAPRCPRRRVCRSDVLVVAVDGGRPRNVTRSPRRSESFPAWRPATP